MIKVAIHELIHAFEFDKNFSSLSCQRYFDKIKNANYPFEAFTEYWAEMIYIKILSLIYNKDIQTIINDFLEHNKKMSDIICYKFNMNNYGELEKINQESGTYFYFIVKYIYMKYNIFKEDIDNNKCNIINKNISEYLIKEIPDNISSDNDKINFTMIPYKYDVMTF